MAHILTVQSLITFLIISHTMEKKTSFSVLKIIFSIYDIIHNPF